MVNASIQANVVVMIKPYEEPHKETKENEENTYHTFKFKQ